MLLPVVLVFSNTISLFIIAVAILFPPWHIRATGASVSVVSGRGLHMPNLLKFCGSIRFKVCSVYFVAIGRVKPLCFVQLAFYS